MAEQQSACPAGMPVVADEAVEKPAGLVMAQRSDLRRYSGFAFPRWLRLIRPDQFSSSLATPPKVRNGRFAVHVRNAFQAEGELVADMVQPQSWRLGLVVPKRHEASAVRRNTIKRVWREVFRLRRAQLEGLCPRQDMVVRLTASLKAKPVKRQKKSGPQAQSGKKAHSLPSAGKVSGVQSAPGLISLRRLCHRDADMLLEQLLCKLERAQSVR